MSEPSSLIWDMPYQRNRFFTGREEIFFALTAALQAHAAVALTQPRGLSGLGVMKTQTAEEYAYSRSVPGAALGQGHLCGGLALRISAPGHGLASAGPGSA